MSRIRPSGAARRLDMVCPAGLPNKSELGFRVGHRARMQLRFVKYSKTLRYLMAVSMRVNGTVNGAFIINSISVDRVGSLYKGTFLAEESSPLVIHDQDKYLLCAVERKADWSVLGRPFARVITQQMQLGIA